MTTSTSDEALRALTAGCGLLDRGPGSALGYDRLWMSGADRERFLGGLVTQEVKDLAPGSGSFGFVTNIKGRVLAELIALALEDAFCLLVSPGRGEAMVAHVGKYKIVDRVELEPSVSRSLLLLGPGSVALLETLGLDDLPSEPWSHRPVSIAGKSLHLVREPDLGMPCHSLWADTADGLDEVRSALLAADPGVVEPGPAVVESLRVLAGRPRYGVDFGLDFAEDSFPQETGLGDEAVSYTKGCYLGQEVVARIHYRGGVNRQLRGLLIASEEPASLLGRAVQHEGREAGRLTSIARIGDRSLGLAILHKRVEPGAEVTLAATDAPADTVEPTAEVVELPFDRG